MHLIFKMFRTLSSWQCMNHLFHIVVLCALQRTFYRCTHWMIKSQLKSMQIRTAVRINFSRSFSCFQKREGTWIPFLFSSTDRKFRYNKKKHFITKKNIEMRKIEKLYQNTNLFVLMMSLLRKRIVVLIWSRD